MNLTPNSLTSRVLRALFVAALVGDLMLLGAVGYTLAKNPGDLVEVRNTLFTDFTSDPSFLLSSPQELASRGFLTDPEPLVTREIRRLRREIPELDSLLAAREVQEGPAVERAKRLARAIWKPSGACGDYADVTDAVRHALRDSTFGCCTDFSEVFMALSAAVDLPVREVHHRVHSFNEVYDPSRGDWVWIDVQNRLMARNDDGELLSLYEIRRAYLRGERVDYEVLGDESSYFVNHDPLEHPYYSPEENHFRTVFITYGNNVFQEGQVERRFGFLPVAGRQVVGYAFGVQPGYKLYVDAGTGKEALDAQSDKPVYWGLALFLAVGTLAYPLAGTAREVRRRLTANRSS